MEKYSIIVVPRDRFSTTGACIEAILQHTPESYDLIVVMGGMPARMQKELAARFGEKVRWVLRSNLLNPSESRNIGLRESATRLAALIDNDTYVRAGWLAPLVRCQAETQASLVVPLILDEPTVIHTAGNSLFITYKDGMAYGCKELCFGGQAFFESCNLKRIPTDYGELHCQLVVVETALRLGVYDEKLREVGEVDSGLTWAKAGCSMWFEPASVVYFNYPVRVTHAEDIRPFLFKWDTAAIVESYEHFKKKWDMDITEGGKWKDFLVFLNSKLGLFPRFFPSRFGMFLDRSYQIFRKLVGAPGFLWRALKTRLLGRQRWES